MSKNKPHSYHSFMFPFRWDYLANGKSSKKDSFSKRTKLSLFHRLYKKNGPLKLSPFVIQNNNNKYNEYTYFHEFVRKSLFFVGNEKGNHDHEELLYYELSPTKGDFFKIIINGQKYHDNFKKDFPNVELTLEFESIGMHIVNSGIGIISYNLVNIKHSSKKEVQAINEFGRRIYPQFLGNEGIDSTKKAFLATEISGSIAGVTFTEDFKSYNQPIHTSETFSPPSHLELVFGSNNFVFNGSTTKKNIVKINKLTDDRMFFVCWYGNDILASSLEATFDPNVVNDIADEVYKFIHGDFLHKTITSDTMQKHALKELTYDRWISYGTLFGVSRDSFVCLAQKLSDNPWVPNLYQHTKSMYYQMAVLCLIQRASVLRFSNEVSIISNNLEGNANLSKHVRDVYKNYIQFLNKLYFREVTSQIQGIELYQKFQLAMKLPEDIKDLDGEISELHQYVSMEQDSELNQIALFFLPLGVVAGLLGANFFNESNFELSLDKELHLTGIFWIIASVVGTLLLTKAAYSLWQLKKN